MLRYVVADLVAGLLRPLVWAALAMLAIAFVITVPARLWVLYINPRASADAIAALNWATGVLMASLWASRWLHRLARVADGWPVRTIRSSLQIRRAQPRA